VLQLRKSVQTRLPALVSQSGPCFKAGCKMSARTARHGCLHLRAPCEQVTADAKPKRLATALQRSAAWLDECLSQAAAKGVAALALAPIGGT
jgi:hypothetical protein